ncbi:MAG: topoisomerase C-terminal repeat-containing protein [Lachnospiraceae bacterium]|nr:topoisomerase C-terminal repeat-containing protein [Lachnospiraceae bacterium]
MAKKLIITEKPSVARDFARVLGVAGRGNGYIENDEYVISWCVGHLVEMLYPEAYDEKYKKWRLEDLPFLPENYKYGVIDNVRQQYETVHSLLHREDISVVYWAGDSGKEGQTIEENIRKFGGVREGMEERRVWIDSQTDEEIRRGINEARPMSDYDNLGKSGIMRTIEDYALGINFSRVLSVKYGKLLNDAAATKSYTAIAVGRVMTCVLGMIVIREREIRDFVETPFYRVIGNFTEDKIAAEWKAVEKSKYFNSPLLYKENGFKKEETAKQLIDELTGEKATVASIEKNLSKKKAPLLFNLAELQAECSKLFKISPDETLQIAQDLYERKCTTYPRTDARVLSTAVAKEIRKNLYKLKEYEPTQKFVQKILDSHLYNGLDKTQYADDSKITDHYAIIPTGQISGLSGLSQLHVDVFNLINRRFLSIFYPPAEYMTVKLVVKVKDEQFFTSSKVLKSKGYMEISGVPKSSDPEEENEAQKAKLLELADKLKQGDELSVDSYSIKEGKTSPPKRYTSGTIILAMENAGNLIEDEELRAQIKNTGIGTSATRAEIIKKLIRVGYINLNKKTQVLSPENLGEMIYEVVSMSVPTLLNPKMTASWEKGLEGIVNGSVIMEQYREKLEEYIRSETLAMIDSDLTENIARQINRFTGKESKGIATRKPLGIPCPACGGELTTTSFGYGCSNYWNKENGCKFNVGSIAGVVISEDDFKELITTGKTKLIDGFVSKNKKKFAASLCMKKEEDGKINISFNDFQSEPEVVEGVKCPACGGDMLVKSFGYGCSNFSIDDKNSCKFAIGKIANKDLNQTQVKELLLNGKTQTIRGFKSKSGKKFDACLVLEKEEGQPPRIVFDFDEVEAKVVKDVKCPSCGGEIAKNSFGYGCLNYKKDDPNSCKFSIGKIASKDLTEAQVKELLTEGKTSTIYGFKSKAGKKFDACLVLEKDEEGSHRINFDFESVEAKVIKDVSCPLCGGEIAKNSFGYGCLKFQKDNPESCRFSIGKMASKDLSEAQVKELLLNGRTSTIYGFKSKSGKKFDARVVLSKDEEGKVTGLKFDFEDLEEKRVKDVKCPVCGGEIVITPYGYRCINSEREKEDSCKFNIGKIAGVSLNEKQVKQLLTEGKTDVIDKFVAKTGMMFSAVLKVNQEGKIVFDFGEGEAVETQISCPKCQNKLKRNLKNYICECKFRLPYTIAGKVLEESTVSELLTEGKTREKVTGFTSKSGNLFDAYLKMNEEDRVVFDFEEREENKNVNNQESV